MLFPVCIGVDWEPAVPVQPLVRLERFVQRVAQLQPGKSMPYGSLSDYL